MFSLRIANNVDAIQCSTDMVNITGFSNKSCSAFACCDRVRYIAPLKKTMTLYYYICCKCIRYPMCSILLHGNCGTPWNDHASVRMHDKHGIRWCRTMDWYTASVALFTWRIGRE